MTNKELGNLGEAVVLAECAKRRLTISQPFGENARYDFIIEEKDGSLSKVQVKTAAPKEDKIIFGIASTCLVKGKYIEKSYTGSEIDYFLLVNSETFEVYKAPVGNSSKFAIRFKPSSMARNANMAEDFLW
jgi:hypothetical protein